MNIHRGDRVIYLGGVEHSGLIEGKAYTVDDISPELSDGSIRIGFGGHLPWYNPTDFDCFSLQRNDIIDDIIGE